MKSGKHMIVGIFFLLFGLSILLRIFFGWHIPIFRTFWALVLIYVGVRMLFGSSWNFTWNQSWRTKDSENVAFDQGDFRWEKDARNRFSTLFGSSKVDLTQAPQDGSGGEVHIDTVFGETKVLIDPKQLIHIRANSVFGEARMPNDDMVAFGTLNYKNGDSAQALKVHANVVFGSIRFEPTAALTTPDKNTPNKNTPNKNAADKNTTDSDE